MSLQIADLKDEHGKFLLTLSRKAIRTYLESNETIDSPEGTPSLLRKKAGIFTTLNSIKRGREALRGCIGIIKPRKPLVKATIDSAINAATKDPRFPPVSREELKSIVIELTVLTPPQKVEVDRPEEYIEKIKIGRDGLIVKQGPFQGTLLPQVPVKHGWDVREFLRNLCQKARLPKDCWRTDAKILAYQGKIWKEEEPNGKIVAEDIQAMYGPKEPRKKEEKK